MNFWLLYDIAWSLLFARWKQTLVAATAVTFSITMFITLLSFMGGLNKLLDSLVTNRTPHVRLYNQLQAAKYQPAQLYNGYKKAYNFISSIKPKKERLQILNSGAILNSIQHDPRVMGIAPKLSAQVFYQVGPTDLPGEINGIDIDAESRLFSFGTYLTAGNSADIKNVQRSIILGKGAADKMLASIGDVIQVTTSTGGRMQMKVVGFYQVGLKQIDDVESYASVNTVQTLLGVPNDYITDIQVKLKTMQAAPQVASEYSRLYDVDAIDIKTADAQYETGSSIRTLISYAVGVTLLIVAGFGTYNILNMMIYEKMDTIAILKACGFSGRDVRNTFNLIALSIGIFGGLLGLVAGFGFSLLIHNIPFHTEALPTIKTYPIDFNLNYYVIASSFSVLTTYLAGYFPARKASRVDPVVIIRSK